MKLLILVLSIITLIAVARPTTHKPTTGHIKGIHSEQPVYNLYHAQAVLHDSGIDNTHPCYRNIQHYLMYQVKEELTTECKLVNIE